jgi:hypothetical protein
MMPTTPCTVKNLIFSICCDPDKNVFQRRKQRLIGNLGALSLCNKTDIPVIFKNMPVLPKKLPSKALDSVARNRFPDFSRNRQPQTTALDIVPADINDE